MGVSHNFLQKYGLGFRVWGYLESGDIGVSEGYIGFRVSRNWGYFLGDPHNKDYSIVYWGMYWAPPVLGDYPSVR